MIIQSMVSSSQPQSYASVLQSGSGNTGTVRTSLKSASFESRARKTNSPTRATLKTASEQGFDGAGIDFDLRESKRMGIKQVLSKFKDTLRATEGLGDLEFIDFIVF